MYFVGFNCNRFSIKLVRIAQDSKLRNLLMTDSRVDDPQKVTWETHAGRQRVKCQVVFRESLDDFKCDSYTLQPYFIYHHYPQKCIEAIQKKTLERFLQNTYLVRESYSSSKREIIVVSSSPFSHYYTLRGDLYPNTTHTYSECREYFGF